MSLDELVSSIPNNEPELKANLAHWVDQWKKSDEDVEKLDYLIGKWHGNVWFKNSNASNEFYESLKKYREIAIYNITKLTMNERLYLFSLTELWDLNDINIQEKIRIKLKAK